MDVKKYTEEETKKELVLIEKHLKDHAAGRHVALCIDCETKHFLAIEGLAQEGCGFFPGEEIWENIARWAADARGVIAKIHPEEALGLAEQAREWRKQLQARDEEACPICRADPEKVQEAVAACRLEVGEGDLEHLTECVKTRIGHVAA